MPRPRVYKTEAIVLKHAPLGDTDKILTLYTPHLGKVRAIAKGVRRPRSKLAGHVEPLTRSAMMIAQGQNLDVVTQSQTIDGFVSLKGDLRRISQAMYAAELLDLFTVQDDANPSLYQAFHSTLETLGRGPGGTTVLRHFELRLLDVLGFKPQMRDCISCGALLSHDYWYFSVSGGGIVCSGCRHGEASARPVSKDAVEVLQFLQRADAENIEGMKMPPSLSREIEVTLREYIRYLLEREVKSTTFLDTLRREAGSSTVSAGPASNE
ncbi:MAG: DNA repair protein RecO [Dehalococcoidia bacterium]